MVMKNTHEDELIIAAVKEGDRERYGELVERYQGMVYAIAWSRLGNHGFCEDAAQETFVKAFKYLSSLRNPEKFASWLGRIARNISATLAWRHRAELARSDRWQLAIESQGATDEADTPEGSLSDTVHESLANLPNTHRECLVLFYIEGKSVREGAEALSISETAFKTRLHRAREAMRGLLEERIEETFEGLKPDNRFNGAVMALLPSAPIGLSATSGVGIAAGLRSAAAGWWFGVAQVLLPLFLMLGLSYGLMRLYTGLDISEMKDSPLKKHRAKQVKTGYLGLVVVVLIISFLTGFSVVSRKPEVQDLFGGIDVGHVGFFTFLVSIGLISCYRVYRMYRSCRTFFLASALYMTVVFTIIAFLGAVLPQGKYLMVYLYFGFILINLPITHFAQKSKPRRFDYSLFLRHSKGLFGAPPLETIQTRAASFPEREAFALFLGRHYLIADHRQKGGLLRLTLPPVKPRSTLLFGDMLFSGKNSWMDCTQNGKIEAHLGEKDLRALGYRESEAKDAENALGRTLETSLALFQQGQLDQALQLLQTESDETLFTTEARKSKSALIQLGIMGALGLFFVGSALYYWMRVS
jgi:RNA polymerase sigma-70 factor, ECF subfamily